MKFYLAKVTWCCEGEEGPIVDYLAIAGGDMVNVMDQLNFYYNGDIDTIELKLINYDRPLVRLPDAETYELIKDKGEI